MLAVSQARELGLQRAVQNTTQARDRVLPPIRLPLPALGRVPIRAPAACGGVCADVAEPLPLDRLLGGLPLHLLRGVHFGRELVQLALPAHRRAARLRKRLPPRRVLR